MCNINIGLNKNNRDAESINEWMTVASWISWQGGNDDGEGYILRDKNGYMNHKSSTKIRYHDLPDNNFLVSHQRLKTSGVGLNNAHPHNSKNFLLMHNGIFSGKGNNERSDTKVYLKLLEKYYEETREVISAIKASLKETGGSYSILLLHKESGRLFYYKNNLTSMNIIEDDEWLFLSTNNNNINIAKTMFGMSTTKHDVKSNIIFELTNDGLLKVGRFTPYITNYYISDTGRVWTDGYYKGKTFIANNQSTNDKDRQDILDMWDKRTIERIQEEQVANTIADEKAFSHLTKGERRALGLNENEEDDV